jgi:glycosyltransferase involved in cell wall biosynthesis
MQIQAILYADPDHYPPMIHGSIVFERQGISQEILCRAYIPTGFPPGDIHYGSTTHITRMEEQGKGSLAKYGNFIRQVLKNADKDVDAFIGYNLHGFLPTRLLATYHRKPLIYHSHDYVENSQKRSSPSTFLLKQFEQAFAKTADIVVVPDQERANFMQQELKLKTAPIVVANCPVAAPDPNSDALQQSLMERNLSFERVVLRQGTIGKGHGLEMTIRSMPFWQNSTWGLVIFGPCEAAYKDELEQLAQAIGVADRFVILPSVSYDQVAKYTVGADLGHALYEPIHVNNRFMTTASNKAMEYQAAGLPLLLSGAPSDQALLAKYQHGLTADVTSAESIAAAVNSILGSDELADAMSKRSFQAFSQEYNYKHQYAPVLEKLRML